MDYLYIRAWEKMMGSYHPHLEIQLDKARKDSAPDNAIYCDNYTHRWHTVDDISSEEVKKSVLRIAERIKEGNW